MKNYRLLSSHDFLDFSIKQTYNHIQQVASGLRTKYSYVISKIYLMRKKFKIISILLMLQCAGCSLLGGKTGYTVASRLKTGMTKDDVFHVLSQGATSVEEKLYRSLNNQSWDNIIESKPALIALRDAEEETGIKVHKYIKVSRTWGMAGFDIFHLFMSEDETLIGYTQQHIN